VKRRPGSAAPIRLRIISAKAGAAEDDLAVRGKAEPVPDTVLKAVCSAPNGGAR
jgi:hypothetical protein